MVLAGHAHLVVSNDSDVPVAFMLHHLATKGQDASTKPLVSCSSCKLPAPALDIPAPSTSCRTSCPAPAVMASSWNATSCPVKRSITDELVVAWEQRVIKRDLTTEGRAAGAINLVDCRALADAWFKEPWQLLTVRHNPLDSNASGALPSCSSCADVQH